MLESCKKLEAALTHKGKSDIDGENLFTELSLVFTLVKDEQVVHVIDIPSAIQKRNMENIIPNAVIAFRILRQFQFRWYRMNANSQNLN